MASGDVTGFTYTKIDITQPISGYSAYITSLTIGAQTKIVSYEELPAETPLTHIRVKILLEVGRIEP